MANNIFIDLDNTLVPNGYRYSQVISEFCAYLYNKLKNNVPFISDLVHIQEEKDLELVRKDGFLKSRFPESLVRTYREVCKRLGARPLKSIEKDVYRIGKTVFDLSHYEKDGLIQGVDETLEFLLEKDENLFLLTLGDEEIQRKKVNMLDLERFFESRIIITPKKDAKLYRRLSRDLDKNLCFMVGDSRRSDVVPPVKIGWKAIHIPSPGGSWAYDRQIKKELTREEEKRVTKLKNFSEIKDKYDEIFLR